MHVFDIVITRIPCRGICCNPLGKGSSIVRHIRTWRSEDDQLWTRMKVFRTSFLRHGVQRRLFYVRLGRDVDATSFLRPRRMRRSRKLSREPKVRVLSTSVNVLPNGKYIEFHLALKVRFAVENGELQLRKYHWSLIVFQVKWFYNYKK